MSATHQHTRNFGLACKSVTRQNGVSPGPTKRRKPEVLLGLLVVGAFAIVVWAVLLSAFLAFLVRIVFFGIRLPAALARFSWVKEGKRVRAVPRLSSSRIVPLGVV